MNVVAGFLVKVTGQLSAAHCIANSIPLRNNSLYKPQIVYLGLMSSEKQFVDHTLPTQHVTQHYLATI